MKLRPSKRPASTSRPPTPMPQYGLSHGSATTSGPPFRTPGLLRGPGQRAGGHRCWVLLRAAAYFASMGIVVERVLTDNGSCYRSRDFTTALGDLRHSRTRPYRPATNGKVERFKPQVAGRVGLRPALELRRPTHSGLDRLAPPLQPSSPPHRHRRSARQLCQQPGRAIQLVLVGS
jgi:hypothetical protein